MVAAGERRRVAGWRIVARKEFIDHILSVRFTILLLLLGLGAVGITYAAGSDIRNVVGSTEEVPALFLKLFLIQPSSVPVFSFILFVSLIGPLLGIAFAFDSVSSERSQGTLPRLVSQPIYRDDVINGKFVAGLAVISVLLVCLTLVVAGLGITRLGVVPTVKEVYRLIAYLVISVVYIGFWLALSSLFSTILRSAATSALASISAWLVAALFSGFIITTLSNVLAPIPAQPTFEEQLKNARVQLTISRLFPSQVYEDATIALLAPEVRSLGLVLPQQRDRSVPGELSLDQSLLIVWPQVTGLIALTVLCFTGAYVAFMRQEIRA